MSKPLLLILALVFGAALALNAQANVPTSADPIDLTVLYAGRDVHARTEVWSAFLAEHFARVIAIDLDDLSLQSAADADVVIIDSPSPYLSQGGFDFAKAPPLGAAWAKPTVLVASAGGSVLRNRSTKLQWW